MIGILSYGLGNVAAFSNVLSKLDVPHSIVANHRELSRVDKLVLPGVGAFDHAMAMFTRSGMREAVDDLVLGRAVPVIGVCVGMQMMAKSSEEGQAEGLGWIDGVVRKFDLATMPPGSVLPHMGWNDVQPQQSDAIWNGLEQEARFYFLHSYRFFPAEAAHVLGVADYGTNFCCAVRRDNIIGVQFHPEKSHRFGARLLKNFSEL